MRNYRRYPPRVGCSLALVLSVLGWGLLAVGLWLLLTWLW